MTTTIKGKALPFIEAVAAEPHRIWSVPEAAKIMGCNVHGVCHVLTRALAQGLVFRGKREGVAVFRGTPFPAHEAERPPPLRNRKPKTGAWTPDPDDLRIPKVVPGWAPPKMVCTRSGS